VGVIVGLPLFLVGLTIGFWLSSSYVVGRSETRKSGDELKTDVVNSSPGAEMDGLRKKVAELEKENSDLKEALEEATKWRKTSDLESALGKLTNEKLWLEKENADLKEALERATKRRR